MIDAISKTQVVLITGPSGAGRTTAINALEDAGFEAIDNMPLTLVPRLFDGPKLARPLALGVDTRNRDFSMAQLLDTVEDLRENPNVQLQILYLKCSVDRLLSRFSETRRKHHLAPDSSAVVGVRRDLDMMQPAKEFADVVIDTTTLSPHELRSEVTRWFVPNTESKMAIAVQSFSYKRGLPRSVDMMFDCRFLKNPYWDASLRSQDGRSAAVQDYVVGDPRFAPFKSQVLSLAELVIPAHVEEGRSHLTIAFGCTGGHHRSVTMAEIVQKELSESGWHVTLRHRELEGQSPAGSSGKKGY